MGTNIIGGDRHISWGQTNTKFQTGAYKARKIYMARWVDDSFRKQGTFLNLQIVFKHIPKDMQWLLSNLDLAVGGWVVGG